MSVRELGNPLAQPRGGGAHYAVPKIVDFLGTSGTFRIPQGYNWFRVTAVGAGGTALGVYNGAGGGALSQSGIYKAIQGLVIECYGAPDSTTDSYAKFMSVSLLAGSGVDSSAASPGVGGTASGGAINNSGGNGVSRIASYGFGGGGGAAGTNGPGANGGKTTSTDAGDGGGMATGDVTGGGGGGGVGASGGDASNSALASNYIALTPKKGVWGAPGGAGYRASSADQGTGGNGGDWGGGGGGGMSNLRGGKGGKGGVRIELW